MTKEKRLKVLLVFCRKNIGFLWVFSVVLATFWYILMDMSL